MSVTQIHEALGSFEFELIGGVPREILDRIQYFGHVAIVPGRMNPLEYGDGTLDAARYVGVVRNKRLADDGRTHLVMDDVRIGGVGMNFWLGDDEDKGAVYEEAVELTGVTFQQAITALKPDSVTLGTIYPVTGSYTGRHIYETPRKAIQYLCDTMSNAGLTVYDTFNRADSVTTLGQLDSGETWVENSGEWGISNNAAALAVDGFSIATVSVGTDFTAQITVQNAAPGNAAWLVFRLSDTNNYLRLGASNTGDPIQLEKVEAGSTSGLGQCESTLADSTTLKIVDRGNGIACYVNGVMELFATTSFNNGESNIGMATDGGGTTFETFSVSPTNDPVSYRVNGDGSLDAGPETNLFVTDPKCVVVRKGASVGEDLFIRALPTTLDADQDMEDFSTRTLMLAENNGQEFATGTADLSTISPGDAVYKDLFGNSLKLTRMISESGTLEQNAAVRAELALRETIDPRRNITLSTEDYDIYGTFTVGDYIYVYDPDAGMYDLANELTVRGARLNPVKLQVVETDWPVINGYTLAYRDHDGTWTDLTDYVKFEEVQPSRIVVGDIGRKLIGNEQTISSRLGTSPTTPADSSVPDVPTFVTTSWQTVAYLDSSGNAHAQQKIVWTTPLNQDGSTITDGAQYEIQYRLDSGHLYSQTWGAASTLVWSDGTPTGNEINTWDQPVEPATDDEWQSLYVSWGTTSLTIQNLAAGTAYDIRIRAIDSGANMSDWSPTEVFTTAVDNIPPTAPAPPTVAGSLIAIQVTHELGKASGGTFNLENDLAYLEIHAEYEPNYVCSEDTMLGLLRANKGLMAAKTPVVGTFNINQVNPVYVKVVAVDISGNRSSASAPAEVTAELIDDQYISDLSVSKLTAGTIQSNWLISGSIKTAEEGARVEMDMNGIRAYDLDSNETLTIDASSGSISMQGSAESTNFIEGSQGWRVDAQGSAQFDSVNVLGGVSSELGNFTELMMDGEPVPSRDFVFNHFQTPAPCVKVHRETAMSMQTATPSEYTLIDWDYLDYQVNNNSMWDPAHPSRLVAPEDGVYLVNFQVAFNAANDPTADQDHHGTIVNVRRNSFGTISGDAIFQGNIVAASANYRTANTGSIPVFMNKGDHVEFFCRSYTNVSSPIDLNVGNDGSVYASLTFMHRFDSGYVVKEGVILGNPNPGKLTLWADWTRSYRDNNQLRIGHAYDRLYQGYFDSSQGSQKSIFGIDHNRLAATLVGKTLVRAEIVFRVQHAAYADLDVELTTHSYSSPPSTWDPDIVDEGEANFLHLYPGGTYTRELPQDIVSRFASGQCKGLGFGPNFAGGRGWYGYMYGGSSPYRPRINFYYA